MTNPLKARNDELKLFARKVAIVFAFALVLAFLWQVRKIVILFFIAGILAAGISPAVRRVRLLTRHYLKRRLARGTAVLIVYFPFLLTVILTLVLTLPHLLVESRGLAKELPQVVDQKILQPLEKYVSMGEIRKVMAAKPQAGDVPIFDYIRGVVRLLSRVIIVLILIVYILIDAERLRNLFLLFYDAEKRSQKRNMIRRMSRRMSSWLSGQLLLGAIIGIATFLALVALRIPYALPLALIAAFGEMIPIIGPIVGAIPALVVALFKSSWQFWSVLAFSILVQQFENLVLVPRIMGKRVSVSPLSVIVAFMIGGSLLGIIGAILAIPVAAIVQVAFEEGFLARRERRQNSDRPGALSTGTE